MHTECDDGCTRERAVRGTERTEQLSKDGDGDVQEVTQASMENGVLRICFGYR